jgi:hypothetical protein
MIMEWFKYLVMGAFMTIEMNWGQLIPESADLGADAKIAFGRCAFAGACQPNDADENNIRLPGWFFGVNIIAPGIKMPP